ncbi:oocyte zinc finger protein XlCOF15-like [Cydia amplana]|uniref:oocyte zinc finger protein XlCOF15-like n=1 Tax=Cydia amplana TaxID=1869771 RepID=UPI002FE64F66
MAKRNPYSFLMSVCLSVDTDPLLNVEVLEVVIKREPPEEASSSVDLAGQEYHEQPPSSSGVAKQRPGEHFLLGVDGGSTSACEHSDDTTTPAARDPETHTAIKSYPCTMCEKEFTFPGSLQRHIRLHTGETPYTCDATVLYDPEVFTVKLDHMRQTPEVYY